MENKPLTERELAFCDSWHKPKVLTEMLFHNWDNLNAFDKKRFGNLRMYQQPLVSNECVVDFEGTKSYKNHSDQETFDMRKRVGDIYCFGARKFGKTQCVEIMDLIIQMLTRGADKVAFASVDLIHLRQVLDPIKNCFEGHAICKLWKKRITGAPDYKFELKNDWILNSVNFNIGCFDDQTEILTKDGWKSVYSISKKDQVLSLDLKTNISDYYSIKRIVKYNHQGNIYHLKGKCLDFYFTPEHRLLYNWSLKQNWQIDQICNLKKDSKAPVLFAHNIQLKEQSDKCLLFPKEITGKLINIKDDDWLEFLGWFIAEGNLTLEKNLSYKIIITQHKHVHEFEFNKICSLLKRMGLNYWTCKDKQIVFSSKEIFEHLKKYCYRITKDSKIRTKSVYCCYNKCFPSYVKNLSKRQTEIILNSFWLGDGSEDKGLKRWMTSSKVLADDLQEAILKIGISCSLLIKQKNRTPVYSVSELKSKTRRLDFKTGLSIEPYNNLVWCVETNPHGLIFIRRNGCCMWTGNSKNPGQQWYGKHVYRVYIEEASLETKEVFDKRKDALSEMGAIFRVSGMTNFTVHSPAGETYYNPNLRKWVVNLPQYVNPTFSKIKEKEAEEFYGGKSSIGFRIYVDGEIVEDGISVFDMERLRELCIKEKKKLYTMEVDKTCYKRYKQYIICDRPIGEGRIFLDADIGLNTTEINVMWESGKTYEYLYNITLHSLTDDEQAEIFKYLIQQLHANVIALDCGDGMGRAIYNELEKTIPKNNLVWYAGTEKIPVGFETDLDGKVIYKDNAPLPKLEFMSEWSVKRLKDLFYAGEIILPEDYKFISQLGQVISIMSGTRVMYKCAGPQGDHLFDSFRVFAIAQWLKCDANQTPDINNNWGVGINS